MKFFLFQNSMYFAVFKPVNPKLKRSPIFFVDEMG